MSQRLFHVTRHRTLRGQRSRLRSSPQNFIAELVSVRIFNMVSRSLRTVAGELDHVRGMVRPRNGPTTTLREQSFHLLSATRRHTPCSHHAARRLPGQPRGCIECRRCRALMTRRSSSNTPLRSSPRTTTLGIFRSNDVVPARNPRPVVAASRSKVVTKKNIGHVVLSWV